MIPGRKGEDMAKHTNLRVSEVLPCIRNDESVSIQSYSNCA